jgi:hypothetical protein
MAGIEQKRRQNLRDFRDLRHRVGFELEPFQVKIAGALLGCEREKLVTLPRKNGKSRLIGTFAAWHLLTTPRAQAFIAANSERQARIVFEYARDVALHPAVDQEFQVRHRELRRPDGGFLQVHPADASRLLGLTPTLAVLDEFCEAKDDSVYVALRTALLPGATMFTLTTSGVGAESPLAGCALEHLGQPDIRTRGFLTDARGDNFRMLEWAVPPDVPLEDYKGGPAQWAPVCGVGPQAGLRSEGPNSSLPGFGAGIGPARDGGRTGLWWPDSSLIFASITLVCWLCV